MATKRYKRDLKELERRRRKGMRMLARDVQQAEVARALGISRQTVSVWAKRVAKDRQAWRRKPLGRPGSMDAARRAELGKLLVAGALANDFPTELWTLPRVRKLIKRQFGLSYSTVHVWRLLKEMGFSSQKPTGRATQRNEQEIERWKAERWPMLKKKPAEKDAP